MTPALITIRRVERRQTACLILLVAFLFIFFPLQMASGKQQTTQPELSKLITNGGYMVKTAPLFISHRQQEKFLPASTLKIVTAMAALDSLGPDFRFETHIYYDQKQNLYIKGVGDPFLTSEELLRLGSMLQQADITEVDNLYLDFSAFVLKDPTPGSNHSSNPYDAPNGALSVNFNSLSINTLKNGVIVSGETQTPTLPIMQHLKVQLPQGIQRINIEMARGSKRFSPAEQYAAELFYAQLKNAGITIRGVTQAKTIPKDIRPTLLYQNSKRLEEMIQECLQYSNNFIANQIFLYCGAHFFGFPATWKKSQDFLQLYLTTHLHLSKEQYSIVDGSGLSRKNLISPSALVTVLEKFAPHKNLLGMENGAYIKSGTLDGVYCYAGYLPVDGSTYVPFALFLNQEQNTRDAVLEGIKTRVAQ